MTITIFINLLPKIAIFYFWGYVTHQVPQPFVNYIITLHNSWKFHHYQLLPWGKRCPKIVHNKFSKFLKFDFKFCTTCTNAILTFYANCQKRKWTLVWFLGYVTNSYRLVVQKWRENNWFKLEIKVLNNKLMVNVIVKCLGMFWRLNGDIT